NNVGNGTLRLGGPDAVPGFSEVTVANGAHFDLNGFDDTILGLSGPGMVQLGSGTLTVGSGLLGLRSFSGGVTGTGGLTKVDPGTFVLAGANTYSGPTQVLAGVLQNGANQVIWDTSAVTVAPGGTYELNGFSETIGSLAGGGNVSVGAGSLVTGGD